MAAHEKSPEKPRSYFRTFLEFVGLAAIAEIVLGGFKGN
jgi:hypothetical protein